MTLDLSVAGDAGRELEGLLEGRRPVVLFYDDPDDPVGTIPEHRFTRYVADGTLVSGEAILDVADPELGTARIRCVLYAAAAEQWRIPAILLALQTRARVNAIADEGLERLLCALLGYSEEETAACLELQVLERC